MKSLGLHIDQHETYIAINDYENINNRKVFTVKNIILFKHPMLLVERLVQILENNLGILNPKFDDISISLPDISNTPHDFFRSKFLDYISYSESYDGYDFNKYFAPLFSESSLGGVFVRSHFNSFAKQISGIDNFIQPSLLILLHIEPSIGFIHKSGDTKLINMKFKLNENSNKSISEVSLDEFLGDHGIYSILQDKNLPITESYSNRLISIINGLKLQAEVNSFIFRSINIVTNYNFLIDKSLITSVFDNYKINFFLPNVNFALACCGLFPAAYFSNDVEIKEDITTLVYTQ